MTLDYVFQSLNAQFQLQGEYYLAGVALSSKIYRTNVRELLFIRLMDKRGIPTD